MSPIPLGRLQAVSLREVWLDEAREFTPWLAEAENLSLLGEALGLTLVLEAKERSVGPFSADILAKDAARDVWVVIENQLEATDHRHLGQLLTYAAGLDAHTVVWVAPEFREEHRAVIDWLNHATAEGFDFFGVQVEVYRIGDSAAAPRFTVVAKPNDWTKSAAAGKRRLEQAEPTESQRWWVAYWTGLIERARAPVDSLATRAPGRGNWQPVMRLLGGKDLTFDAVASFSRSSIRAEIYIDRSLAKAAFHALEAQKEAIDADFGEPVSWELLPQARACRIAAYRPGEASSDPVERAAQYEWLLDTLSRLVTVMKPRIEAIDISSLRASEEQAVG